MLRPSFHTGFAPRDFAPAYPSLWRGCVGAWCPSLGPTGGTLRDWAGKQYGGTLTSLTLANAWLVSERYSIVCDGTGYVSAGQVLPLTFPLSLSCWFYPTTTATDQALVWRGQNGFGRNYSLYFQTTGKIVWNITEAASNLILVTSTNTAALNTWSFVYAQYDGATMSVYVNGTTTTAAGTANPDTTSTRVLNFGADGQGNSRYTGRLDDIRVNNCLRTPNEVKLLSLRRGIAYELDLLRKLSPEQAAAARAFYFNRYIAARGVA